MATLEAHLHGINNFEDFSQLLNHATATTTCWGSRIVTVENWKGSVNLDEVVWKCINIQYKIEPTNKRSNWSQNQAKLNAFYTQTDAQIKKMNYFSQFLFFIRELSFGCYTARISLDL